MGRPAAGGPAAHRHLAVGGDRPGRSRAAAAGGPPGPLRPRLPAGGHAGHGRRSPPSRRPPPGWCSASRSTTWARSRRPRRCWRPRPSGPSGDDEVVRIATVRRRNLFRGCRREADAVEVGRAATSRVASTAARDELLIGEAEVLAISGRPLDALALLEQRRLSRRPPARARRHPPRRRAGDDRSDGRGGRGERAGVSTTTWRWATSWPSPRPARHRVNLLFALVQAGRLDEAEARGRAWFEVAARAGLPLGVIWLGVHLARCALAQGRPATALRWTAQAGSRDRRLGLRGPAAGGLRDARPSPTACSATPPPAPRRADEVDALRPGSGSSPPNCRSGGRGRSSPPVTIAAARDRAARRRRRRRAAPATCPPRPGCSTTPPASARRRRPPPRLAGLGDATDSALVAARAEHAAALVADDGAAPRRGRRPVRGPRRRCCWPPRPLPPAPTRGGAGTSNAGPPPSTSARSELAARCEGARTPALVRTRHRRAAHRPRTRDRRAGRRRSAQPADRRAAVPLGAHGRQPPRPHLRQARRVQPRRPRRRPRPGGAEP